MCWSSPICSTLVPICTGSLHLPQEASNMKTIIILLVSLLGVVDAAVTSTIIETVYLPFDQHQCTNFYFSDHISNLQACMPGACCLDVVGIDYQTNVDTMACQTDVQVVTTTVHHTEVIVTPTKVTEPASTLTTTLFATVTTAQTETLTTFSTTTESATLTTTQPTTTSDFWWGTLSTLAFTLRR